MTAQLVSANSEGRQPRSSVGHSRGGSSEPRLAVVGIPRSARLCGCDSWRRVTRCAESMEGRAALAGGVRTADGVPPSAMGREQRSSVGHSRGGSSEHRLAVGVVTAVGAAVWLRLWATSDTLCREHGRSCCDGGRCEDGPWRAAQRHGVRAAQLGRAQPRRIERASTRNGCVPQSARLWL